MKNHQGEPLNEEFEDQGKSPLWVILGIFLVLLMIVSLVPYYGLRADPRPSTIPPVEEVVPENYTIEQANFPYSGRQDFPSFVQPYDPVVKQTADRIIAASGCRSEKICQAKAIFYFVRDNFQYVSDPTAYEFIKTPREALRTRVGDCDDATILTANLLAAIGIPSRFVFIPRHVYLQAYVPDAPRKYQQDGWVSLDPTCDDCEFGQVPYQHAGKEQVVVG